MPKPSGRFQDTSSPGHCRVVKLSFRDSALSGTLHEAVGHFQRLREPSSGGFGEGRGSGCIRLGFLWILWFIPKALLDSLIVSMKLKIEREKDQKQVVSLWLHSKTSQKRGPRRGSQSFAEVLGPAEVVRRPA